MRAIRLIYRLGWVAFCIITVLCFYVVLKLTVRSEQKRQAKTSALVHFLCHYLMKRIACKIQVKGLDFLKKGGNYLIVANHVSYLDVTVLYAIITHCRFISHYEWKEDSPLLHLIAEKSGVYFIERRNFSHIRKELREAANILNLGLHLVLFPEGTSTDGTHIEPFHPLFFASAVHAKKSVLPVCINYKKVESAPLSAKNKDLICWYDDKLSFWAHVIKLLQLKSLDVEVSFLPPLSPKDGNSRWLAKTSQQHIQQNFMPVLKNDH